MTLIHPRCQLVASSRVVYESDLISGQSDPDLFRAIFDQIIQPNVTAFGARIALAQERGDIRADADVQTLRDLLYGVIEYRLFHAMPIEPRYIDAVLEIAFHGVR